LQYNGGTKGWDQVCQASTVAVDRSGQVWFTQQKSPGTYRVYRALGSGAGSYDNAESADSSALTLVQWLYQGKDAKGNAVTYVWQGGKLRQYNGRTQGWDVVSQASAVAADVSGQVLFLQPKSPGTYSLCRALGGGAGSYGFAGSADPNAACYVQDLYQGRNSSNQPVAYIWQDNNLLQYNGGTKGWDLVCGADAVAADRSGQVLFTQQKSPGTYGLHRALGSGASHYGSPSSNPRAGYLVQGLYQGKDAAGRPVAYFWQHNILYQYTGAPLSWDEVSQASAVAVDGSGQVFFTQQKSPGAYSLCRALGGGAGSYDNAGSAEPSAVTLVQWLYQGKDAAGNPVPYILQNGKLLRHNGRTLGWDVVWQASSVLTSALPPLP
jgi:hypothetical protein